MLKDISYFPNKAVISVIFSRKQTTFGNLCEYKRSFKIYWYTENEILSEPGMVVYACNPSTSKADTGGSLSCIQSELHGKTLS